MRISNIELISAKRLILELEPATWKYILSINLHLETKREFNIPFYLLLRGSTKEALTLVAWPRIPRVPTSKISKIIVPGIEKLAV